MGFLSKPFTEDALIHCIETALASPSNTYRNFD
jgi:FixJ family two-component response regulator